MDFTTIETWLKNTIPGIIVLGAVGSIAAIIFLYFFKKLSNYFITYLKFILDKMIFIGIYKIMFKYLKFYLKFKGTLSQLKNRKKDLSIVIMHKKYLAIRDTSYLISIIFFLISYFLMLFTGTEYLKTSVTSVALTIIFFHDAILNALLVYKIEEMFFGQEEEFAKNTYVDENTLTIEVILFSEKLNNKKKI